MLFLVGDFAKMKSAEEVIPKLADKVGQVVYDPWRSDIWSPDLVAIQLIDWDYEESGGRGFHIVRSSNLLPITKEEFDAAVAKNMELNNSKTEKNQKITCTHTEKATVNTKNNTNLVPQRKTIL